MNNKINTLLTKISKEQIEDLYITQNLRRPEVASILGVTNSMLGNLIKHYNISKDMSKQVIKRKETCLEKYGVDNPSKSNIVKEKISQSNTLNATERVSKSKQTKLDKYGNSNYNNVEQSKLTKKVKYNNENYNNRDKYKLTMIEKYGEDNYFKLDSFRKEHQSQLCDTMRYTKEFKEVFNERNKAINFIKDKNYSYFELSKLFNAPYYTIQFWATRLNLKEYLALDTMGSTSHYEDEICEFLYSIGINDIIRTDRAQLNGVELDIFIPSKNIAIEFNDTYWHSDLYKEEKYHFNKSINAQNKGIRLIHIYQNEWDDLNTREKIKQLLKIACSKVYNRIYARECAVKEITNREAKLFNETTHLQGHRNAQVTYGLFYNNELVQLMSFSKTKYNKNLKGDNDWEIIRECPSKNHIVVGGVSKLFKHFVNDYKPEKVFSYCDFNKFTGNSYEKLGMMLIGYTKPDMKYIIKGKVVNRQPSKYKDIKHLIEARVYGAGSKKYMWENCKIS